MKRVYKYHIDITGDVQYLELPEGSALVHARTSAEGSAGIWLWFEVHTDRPVTKRGFQVIPTGVDIPFNDHWVATVSTAGLHLVWHVYEAT